MVLCTKQNGSLVGSTYSYTYRLQEVRDSIRLGNAAYE